MARAVAAADEVRGRTSPNPWVGAVVVPAGPGTPEWFEGATAPPGGPHAEVAALRAAGARAESGTLYVTLEPCSHHGRTPPCTEAILASGIRRVVVGVADPDTRVDGSGIDALRSAGIEVEVVRLIAVLDGLRIGISRIPLYSLVFQCRPVGGELKAHPLECSDVGWFPLDDLPYPLAGAERWGKHVFAALRGEPIEVLYDSVRSPVWRGDPERD